MSTNPTPFSLVVLMMAISILAAHFSSCHGVVTVSALCNRTECACSRSNNTVVTLDCQSGVGLTELPDFTDHPNLEQLNLPGNNIEIISRHDFNPIRDVLKKLDLSNNKLHTIESGALDNMRSLNSILLSKNFLESFSEDVFLANRDPRSFKEVMDVVDVSHNQLKAPPANFAEVRKYTEVLLNNNPMGNLKNHTFAGPLNELNVLDISALGMTEFNADDLNLTLIRIVDLYLDFNQFDEVNRTMVKGIAKSKLRTLSFRFCGLQYIGTAAFLGATDLRYLLLDGNRFEVLKGRPFQDLNLTILDLANSSITDIRKTAFKRLNVTNLYLMDNNIGVIHESEFKGIIGVQLLDLTNSSISEIKGSPFAVMESLKMLHLRNNHLKDESMVTGLHGMPKINFIELNGNRLTRVPNINSSVSPHLKNLHVTHNNISSISRHDLRGMDNVDFLYLAWNPLEGFGESDDTFAECGKLRGLDMVHTRISSLPNMTFLPKLENLHVNSARLTSIPEDLCCSCSNLKFLEVSNNGIASLPNISCEMLYDLDASHNKIESMHPDFLKDMKYLNRLSLESNFISEIDTDFFKENINLEHLSLKHNKLVKLPSLSEVPHLIDFDASYNRIKKIDKGTFVNQVIMDELYLNDNQIGSIDPEAFSISSDLKVLNLSNNVNLREWMVPRGGFPFLAILSLEGLPNLHQVPHMFELRRVQELYFTYSYHCCIWEGYIRPTEPTMSFEEEGSGSLSYTKTTVPPPKLPENIVDCNNQTAWENFVKIYNMHFCETMNCLSMNCNQLGNSIYTNETMIIGDMSEEVFTSRGGKRKKIVYSDKVSCIPHNSPLTPCENLMDPWILRIAIWAIWVLALLGNGTVLFIGIATKGKLESNDLLICNLAFADFCMGVYLAFLAVVDIRTFTDSKSTFYQSALDWQLGPGCKSAGFIAVFSTELSIFILVVLTLERVYTISHTFDQNEEKRRKVVIGLCVFGWFWAAGLAMLPIFGVNSYDKVAVCLPYVTENWWDRFYIGFILTLNFAFFVVIVFSYAYIFIHACRVSPSGHLKQRRKDILTAVSKIAVLILTAFFCWAPIAVIGYLSLINLHLVSAAEAKYFVIFVYPLNACVNPFIYAIFTRGFRNKFSSIFQRSKDRVTSFPPNDRRRRSAFAPEYNMNERHSPGGEELMKLRQSRRSNSLVVQFVDSNLTTPSPTFNPPLGCNFGRRASLPPGFGSTLNSLDTVGHGSQGSSNSHLPHYSLPFRLGSVYDGQNSSLPNLPEESDGDYEAEPTLRSSKSENIDQRTAVLTSSLDSNLRRLSVVEEEENEVETPGNFYPCEKEDSLDEDEDGNKDENVSVSSSEDYSDASDIPFGGGCGEEMCTDLDSLMVGGTGVILSSTAEVRIRKTCSRGGDSIKSRDSAYTTGHHSKSYSLEDVRIASLSSDHSDYHPDISSHVMFQREREDIEQFMTSHSDSRTNDMRKAFSDSEFRSERKMDGSESSEGCNIVHRANCSLSHVHMLSSREICEHDRINQHHVDENIKNADSSLVPEHIRSGLIISKQQPRDDDGGSGSEDCNTHSSNFSSRSSSVSPEPLIINNDTTIQAKKSTKLILEKTIETDL